MIKKQLIRYSSYILIMIAALALLTYVDEQGTLMFRVVLCNAIAGLMSIASFIAGKSQERNKTHAND